MNDGSGGITERVCGKVQDSSLLFKECHGRMAIFRAPEMGSGIDRVMVREVERMTRQRIRRHMA